MRQWGFQIVFINSSNYFVLIYRISYNVLQISPYSPNSYNSPIPSPILPWKTSNNQPHILTGNKLDPLDHILQLNHNLFGVMGQFPNLQLMFRGGTEVVGVLVSQRGERDQWLQEQVGSLQAKSDHWDWVLWGWIGTARKQLGGAVEGNAGSC